MKFKSKLEEQYSFAAQRKRRQFDGEDFSNNLRREYLRDRDFYLNLLLGKFKK